MLTSQRFSKYTNTKQRRSEGGLKQLLKVLLLMYRHPRPVRTQHCDKNPAHLMTDDGGSAQGAVNFKCACGEQMQFTTVLLG